MTSIRETGTKTKIKNAFLELLIEKGMDNLTISDIARKANINRGTFYLHYVDKFDLLDKLEAGILDNLQGIFEKYEHEEDYDDAIEIINYKSILEALKYVQSHIELANALVSINGNENLQVKIKQLIGETIQKRVDRSSNLSLKMGNLPPDYAQEILLSSIVSILLLWIKKGALETPEEIATLITKAKQISPYELLL